MIDGCGASGRGDGLGAAGSLNDSTSTFVTLGAWNKNTDGCGTTKTFTGTTSRSSKILNVQPWLAYTDNGHAYIVKQTCYDNPMVAGNQC